MSSLPLFDQNRDRRSIDEKFEDWRKQHPEAVELLRRLALDKVRTGAKRIGIAALWERARWDFDESPASEGFRWNNSLRTPLARYLAETTPELATAFEFRARARRTA